MIDLEICGDSLTDALIGSIHGFKRIELCANLLEGGTTPSIGLIQKCASLKTIEVHVMIRLRAGNFSYSMEEVEIMSRDIVAASIAGAKGVVFGCLDKSNNPDIQPTLYLAEIARQQKLEITFHRAFDLTNDPFKTLESLHHIGVTRILTSGGKSSAMEGKQLISDLVIHAKKFPIQIMAGGGVNAENASQLKETGVSALHFTARKKIEIPKLNAGFGVNYIPDEEKIKSILEAIKN